MSADDRGDGAGGRFGRREFLALATSGAGLLVSAGYLGTALAQPQQTDVPPRDTYTETYRGRKILVQRRQGRPELSIDGERIVTVNSNGAYRAAGFAFSPQSTPAGLAKKLIDYRIDLGG